MGRLKDIIADANTLEDLTAMPIQYITVDEDTVDIEEVNFELQLAADEAKDAE